MKRVFILLLALVNIVTLNNCQGPNSTGNFGNINKQGPNSTGDKQGPNSTGGLFRLTDKDGSLLKNTKFSVLSQSNNSLNQLAESSTNDKGEAVIPENIFTPSLISELKNSNITLVIKIVKDNKEINTTVKDISFKSDKLVEINAQAEAPKALEVKVSQKSLNLSVGKTSDISAEVVMSDGSVNNAVTWSSSDETIATVKNGKISALKKGATIISARSTSDLQVYNNISIAVTDDTVVSNIRVVNSLDKSKIEAPLQLKLNSNIKIEAIVNFSDGATSANVIWKSSDESIATVGRNTGIVTGVAKGTAIITAYATDDMGKSYSVQVDIVP